MSSTSVLGRHSAIRIGHLRFDRFLLVPIVGPMVLLTAASANWMFDPAGLIDAFATVGRFWHYPDHNPLFEEYKGSRLPWILPGFVLHALLDEVNASYLLHTTVLVGSSVAVYLLLRDALDDRLTAAVTAAAWSCYTWMHGGQGGWNYHVYSASTYYVFSLWMFTRATTSPHRRRWLVGAGALLASAIHTHIVFAGFAPIAALLCLPALGTSIRGVWREAAAAAGWVIIGALAATTLLGAIDVMSGGSWLFFMPQIEYTLYFAREGNRWLREPMTWIPEARYLVIPCVVLVAGVAWLIGGMRQRRPVQREWRFRQTLVLQGVLAFVLMLFVQFGARQTVLDYSYVSVPLFCHVFPMLGALLWQGRPMDCSRAFLLSFAAALVMVAPLLVLLPAWLPAQLPALVSALRLPSSPVVLAPFVISVVVLLLCSIAGRGRLLIFVLGYAFMNAWLAAPVSYGFGTPGINRDMFVVFRSLDRFATTIDPSLFAVRYWGEPGEVAGADMTNVFNSFAAIRRRSLVTAAYDRPGIRVEELTERDLYSAHCLGVFSTTAQHNDVVRRVTRRFADINIPFRPVAHHVAQSGPVSLSVTILTRRPAEDPRPGLLPCPPLP